MKQLPRGIIVTFLSIVLSMTGCSTPETSTGNDSSAPPTSDTAATSEENTELNQVPEAQRLTIKRPFVVDENSLHIYNPYVIDIKLTINTAGASQLYLVRSGEMLAIPRATGLNFKIVTGSRSNICSGVLDAAFYEINWETAKGQYCLRRI